MPILAIILVLLLLVFALAWAMTGPREKLQKAWSGIAVPFTSKTQDLATPLKAWAETSLSGEPALRTWLVSLSAEGLQALGEKIAEFCREMNVDLAWLLAPAEDADPEARQAVEDIVTGYCKICQKAVRNQRPAR
jgi:hypothetical protein